MGLCPFGCIRAEGWEAGQVGVVGTGLRGAQALTLVLFLKDLHCSLNDFILVRSVHNLCASDSHTKFSRSSLRSNSWTQLPARHLSQDCLKGASDSTYPKWTPELPLPQTVPPPGFLVSGMSKVYKLRTRARHFLLFRHCPSQIPATFSLLDLWNPAISCYLHH